MMAWLTALALMAAKPVDLSGVYRTHQMEVGAELVLKADGTFLYSLDYGAVSEAGKGRWVAKDGVVRLNSQPLTIDLMRETERSDAAFADESLSVDHGALALKRWDTVFTFYRDKE